MAVRTAESSLSDAAPLGAISLRRALVMVAGAALLVGSIVLRCDDCVTYHLKQCADIGVTRPQFLDAFNVALVVGGSITIPHLRRAVDRLDQLLEGR